MTGSHRKEGRRPGGRTPMQLLADAVDTYEVGNLARWWEWEAASEGRRQLTWSVGGKSLRRLAELGHAVSDEDVAAEELSGEETSLHIPPPAWTEILAARIETELLAIAETEGLLGAKLWVDRHLALTRDADDRGGRQHMPRWVARAGWPG